MALKQPIPVSFPRACYLCAVALVAPVRFSEIEKADSELLEKAPNADAQYRISKVRNAFLASLGIVIGSALIGSLLGWGAYRLFGRCAEANGVLQVVGAGILLWATLAVRGWDVQTFSGATLTERVNQWIYRGLYCISTALLVMTVVWSAWP